MPSNGTHYPKMELFGNSRGELKYFGEGLWQLCENRKRSALVHTYSEQSLSLLHSSILLCISVVSHLSVLLNVTNTWLASEVKALLMMVLHLSILSGGLSKMPLICVPRKFSRYCTTTKAICVEWASNFFNSVEWTQIRHVSEGKQRSYNGLFGVDVSASINMHIRRPTTKSAAEGAIVDLISCSELKLNWFDYRIQIMCR